jgi:hypothetical protein
MNPHEVDIRVHPTKRQVSKHQVAKRPVSKRPVSKRQVYKTSGLQNVRFQNVLFAFLFKVKSVSFLLITSDYGDIWHKMNKPSKRENKTKPSLCLQTWLKQNPCGFSAKHKYTSMDVFFQPDILKT